MTDKTKRHIKNSFFTLLIMTCAFIISLILQELLSINDHITTVFVFGVFIISMITDGYFYGIFAAFFSVLAVNFAFTFPYFSFNFTIPENIISAFIMITISVMTSAMVTKLKLWEALKAEGEKEKMRANLLRAVSHDLRTPLTAIYGSGDALLENYHGLSDEHKFKLLSGIKADAEWLIRMVENLLSVTRIDGAKIEIIKTPTALFELIDSVIIKFKKRYPTATLKVDIPQDIIIIPMDAMLIEQVLLNILENSQKHAGELTEVRLTVTVDGSDVVFQIEDDGCGIPDEKIKNLFDGYCRDAEKNTDTKKRSAGIGLTVCATIIRAHESVLVAKNRSEGGALFRFALKKEDYDEQQ